MLVDKLVDKLVKSRPSSKIFVSVAGIAIISLATYNWTIAPQTGHLHAAQQYEITLKNVDKRIDAIEKLIAAKKDEVIALRRDVTTTEADFFAPEEAKKFFTELEAISQQHNCSIEELNFLPGKAIAFDKSAGDSSGVIVKRAEVKLTGRYNDIIGFLSRIEACTKRVSVGDMIIEPAGGNTRALSCHMTITIYAMGDKEHVTNE